MSEDFIGTRELLAWLDISKPTLLAWLRLKADPLPGVKVGGHWKFRRKAVLEWWMRREKSGSISEKQRSAKDRPDLEAWLSAASKVITDKKK
jgi:excisionase family DNA binding protein